MNSNEDCWSTVEPAPVIAGCGDPSNTGPFSLEEFNEETGFPSGLTNSAYTITSQTLASTII